jgi:hypothetical protein
MRNGSAADDMAGSTSGTKWMGRRFRMKCEEFAVAAGSMIRVLIAATVDVPRSRGHSRGSAIAWTRLEDIYSVDLVSAKH